MLDYIFQSLLIACATWVYHCVLREKFLSNWFLWGFKKFDTKSNWYYFWYEPIFACEKCFAGQLALWLYFWLHKSYQLFYHIGFIALTILFVTLIVNATTKHD